MPLLWNFVQNDPHYHCTIGTDGFVARKSYTLICDLKNACQYLYFKMLLYISQNADMSAKWRHLGIIMSSNWFYDVTVVFQFWICDFLKKNACQYLYFKMLLYISQNADMSGKWRNFGIMMSVFRFLIITFTF